MPCALIAHLKRREQIPITIHTANVDDAVKLESHPNTVLEPEFRDIYARNMKLLWKMTQRYGMPHLDVRLKKAGALFSSASAYKDLDPCSRPWLPEDHADVMTTALMTLGNTLTPAFSAAMTNGDWAAFPVDVSKRGSFEGTISPTTKRERM
jgi:hypothetical protein